MDNIKARLGPFCVTGNAGRQYLHFNDKMIGECVAGDWEDRYGSIPKWLKVIERRSNKRLAVIAKTMAELEREGKTLYEMLGAIDKIIF